MKQAFGDLRSALMFITILPAGKNVAWSPMGMIRFFPLVGLILGILLLVFDRVISLFWPTGVTALLDVLCLVVLTGAFHLDGLGDAADGLFSHRSKEKVLEIMKDSRSGMMGLVAVFCLLAIKTAGIYSVKMSSSLFETIVILLIVPAYARASMLAGIRLFDYGRKGTGTGLELFERRIGTADFVFVLIPVAISLFLGYKCLVLNLAFVAATAGILWFYKLKLNCITGDMLGAMAEVVEAVLFLAAGASLIV